MAHKLTLADTGATGTIKAPLPVHDWKAGWVVKDRPVAVHGSTDDARDFASAILATWQAHHNAWLAHLSDIPQNCGISCPRCGRSGFRRSGAGLAWHVERCAA